MRLPQRINSFHISKGKPDEENVEVRDPGPKFMNRPFRDYMEEAVIYSDSTIMGYDKWGQFTASRMAAESRRRAFIQMTKDNSIVGLTNDRRKRNF
jgi:hypothetical protein